MSHDSQEPARDDFQVALLASYLEDAREQPCALCDGPGSCVGIWFPSRTSGRRGITFSLCQECFTQPDVQDRLDTLFRAHVELRDQVLAKGWEINEADLFYEPGHPIPDWVEQALAAGGFPRPFLFFWRTDPDAVVVLLSDWEVHTFTPGDESQSVSDRNADLLAAIAMGGGKPVSIPSPWARGGRLYVDIAPSRRLTDGTETTSSPVPIASPPGRAR
jgi:hypothetical protein